MAYQRMDSVRRIQFVPALSSPASVPESMTSSPALGIDVRFQRCRSMRGTVHLCTRRTAKSLALEQCLVIGQLAR